MSAPLPSASARIDANVDVKNSHYTIEPEFFDLETLTGPDHILFVVNTYPRIFNFVRKTAPATTSPRSNPRCSRPRPGPENPAPTPFDSSR